MCRRMHIAGLIEKATDRKYQNAYQEEMEYKLLKQLHHEVLCWVFLIFILQGGDPKIRNLFIKKLCVYPYMFKFQARSKDSPIERCNTPIETFYSTAHNSFWTLWFWCLLVLLAFFCFTSSISAKSFHLRIFFVWRNKKRVAWGEIWLFRARLGQE